MYKLVLVVLALAAIASAQILYSPYSLGTGLPVARSYGYPYAYGAYGAYGSYGTYGTYGSPYLGSYLYK